MTAIAAGGGRSTILFTQGASLDEGVENGFRLPPLLTS